MEPNSETTHLGELRRLRKVIDGAYGVWGSAELNKAVSDTHQIGIPSGTPETVEEIATDYRTAAKHLDTASLATEDIRRMLPQCWVGDTHIAAGEALAAVGENTSRAVEAAQAIGAQLDRLVDPITSSNKADQSGLELLVQAGDKTESITAGVFPDPFSYDGETMRQAHHLAMQGIDTRVTAHTQMRDAARDASRSLYDLAGQARLYRLADSPLSSLDEVVIANAGADSRSADGAVLAAVMADRAADAMGRLSPGDRQALNEMLANAKSAEQRAYLLKALAAGYSITELARFNRLIAAHGNDPYWLREHLSPVDLTGADPAGQQTPTLFQGTEWTQGQYPTCVASSTVTARAQVDPLYALELTTGGHPGDPAYDNPQAFAERLRDEQVRVYDGGRAWYQDLFGSDGMTNNQSRTIAEQEISPHTGTRYENQKIDSAGDREAVLGTIERAVDEGYPVPISVTGDGGHQMLVVGHEGDMLQIYNPWGYTVWVSEDDFVNGNMDRAGTGVPETPTSVRIPQMGGQK